MDGRRNVQSGRPTAETEPAPSKADRPEGTHYEPDPDQIVKVVHQVKPDSLPLQGPTDFEARGPADDTASTDVRLTPPRASVRESGPKEA
jgi:hypothetical protein